MISKGCLGKLVGVAALLLSPLSALAQTPVPYNERYGEPAPEVRRGPGPPSGYGAAVQLGGGVMNFSGSGARGVTDVGGSWDLRLAWGTRSILGLEGAYVGSAQQLTVGGLDPNAVLIGNGAEGDLRLNAPFVYNGALVAPFGFGGLGWTRFDVVNDNFNESTVREKDHVMTVPVGGGLAAAYRGFIMDARFTYRFVYNNDLLGSTNMDNWIASLNFGSEF
jgi:hypothetical protein